MWVRTEPAPGDDPEVWLPDGMVAGHGTTADLCFGMRQVRVRVTPGGPAPKRSSFQRPLRVRISECALRDLLVRDGVVYQLRLARERIELGPVTGLLLGTETHRYSPRHMVKYSDRLGVYTRTGGIVCAFSSETVDWERKTAHGLVYNVDCSLWEYAEFPLPPVVYRRNFHTRPGEIQRLNDAGALVFNSRRFLKPEVYQIAAKDRRLLRYIPPTELVSTYGRLTSFIDEHRRVILKPTDLSRGRGICFMEKRGRDYAVADYRGTQVLETILRGDAELKAFFTKNRGLFTRYLVQKQLSLAEVDGRLFDIRVVMQKSPGSRWKCTGIECRLGGPGMMVTNISRGGTAMTLPEALERCLGPGDHNETIREIHTVSNRLCAAMDTTGEHFGEFGLDLALDTGGRLWFIEANVFPSFKGFIQMDPITYTSIRQAPLLYAAAAQGFPPSGGSNAKVVSGK